MTARAEGAQHRLANVYRFVTGKLKPYHGMMTLIHAFYDSIAAGSARR